MSDAPPRPPELSTAESQLHKLLALTPFMLTLCSRELVYEFVTPSYAAMLGKSVDQVIGHKIAEVMGESGLAVIMPYVERVLQGEVVGYERSVPFAGVGSRVLSVVYTPNRNQSNGVIGWAASIIDITERRQAEKALDEAHVALREREQDFETLAEGSPVLLWVNGPDGCEFVNRAYLDFVGVDHGTDIRGYDWARFIHPEDRDGYLEAYVRAYGARLPFSADFRFRRNDGVWRWMRSEARARVRESAVRYVGATIDITERKAAEEALREADRRKDTFLAVLAHELRNPLAPIRAGLEILRLRGDTPEAVERILPVLERQVTYMVQIIDDLLDVSRITSGKIQLRRQPTRLNDLVYSAVEANRSALEEAGLTVDVNVPETDYTLDVDPTRIVQALSNVLNNAGKFTPRGGQVHVTAAIDSESDPRVVTLRIRDTGQGISQQMLPHIFELFVQGDGDRGNTGLGIGLALAKQLVELHGGQIVASSDGPGHGSAFTIRIPALRASGTASEARVAMFEGTRPRVLIIDDNADAADTLAELVVALGGISETAPNGMEGLARAATFNPDVILLDIGMPGMDGYETCRRLREALGRSTRIVAVTGWGQSQDRERASQAGFDRYLTKPADSRALQRVLMGVPPNRPS